MGASVSGAAVTFMGFARSEFVVFGCNHSLLYVKFARLAVGAFAVVVENTVCNVGSLLDFSDEIALSDGVYTSGRQEKYIAWLGVIFCE